MLDYRLMDLHKVGRTKEVLNGKKTQGKKHYRINYGRGLC